MRTALIFAGISGMIEYATGENEAANASRWPQEREK
jgi:hypothetical protein